MDQNEHIIDTYYKRVGIFMLKGLLIFQSLVILLMLIIAVLFIVNGSYLQGALYLGFGAIFTGYALSGRKRTSSRSGP